MSRGVALLSSEPIEHVPGNEHGVLVVGEIAELSTLFGGELDALDDVTTIGFVEGRATALGRATVFPKIGELSHRRMPFALTFAWHLLIQASCTQASNLCERWISKQPHPVDIRNYARILAQVCLAGLMTTPPVARRVVHLTLVVALAASIAANVLAAEPVAVSRAVAAWPPIALLLVVDVLGRVPHSPGWLGRLTVMATGLVAVVAAVASFSHMRSVALTAGESPLVAVLFPLSVDGLAVVCSVALIELARREDRPSVGPAMVTPVVSVESPVPVVARSQEATDRMLPVLNNN